MAVENSFEIQSPDSDPTISITWTLAGSPVAKLNGVTVEFGRVREHPEHGQVVVFDYYVNEKVLRGKVKKGQSLTAVLATKPDLAATVAAAEAALAAAHARLDAAAEGLEPVGYQYETGCDAFDRHQLLWPEGTPYGAIERRLKSRPIAGLDALERLRPEDFRRVAAETGAAGVEANLSTWGGYRFGPEGLARLLALAAEREAEQRTAREQKDAERKAAEAARRAQFADLELTVLRRGTDRSEGPDPWALVEVRSRETGEALRFKCRNIFDFGYVVNPAYAVVPGAEGGIATTRDGARVWNTGDDARTRPLTDFERHCLDYLHEFPPLDNHIRM